MGNKTKKILAWCALALIMATVFALSGQTAEESSETSDGFLVQALRIVIPDYDGLTETEKTELIEKYTFIERKAAHFSVYMLMGVAAATAMTCYDVTALTAGSTAFIICGLYSVTDEVHQYFVPGRACEARDVLIDSAGALVGIVILLRIISARRKCTY